MDDTKYQTLTLFIQQAETQLLLAKVLCRFSQHKSAYAGIGSLYSFKYYVSSYLSAQKQDRSQSLRFLHRCIENELPPQYLMQRKYELSNMTLGNQML